MNPHAAKRFREPLEVGPFNAWVAKRKKQIARELDAFPAIEGRPEMLNVHDRLLAELGWSGEAGARRLFRWANENAGYAERAEIENALDSAGADFYEVYPYLAHEQDPGAEVFCRACRTEVMTRDGTCPWCGGDTVPERPPQSRPRLGQGRRITEEQIRAAHVLYWQGGLSLTEVSRLLYERFGYASVSSGEAQIRRHFKLLGLPRRPVAEANLAAHIKHGMFVGGKRPALYKRMQNIAKYGQCQHTLASGKPCPRAAHPGTTHCGYHRPEEIARRTERIVFEVNARGKNRLRWVDRTNDQEAA